MEDRGEKINAIISRDSSYDGVFVYGVKSTMIYCRLSCPSRRPNTENIRILRHQAKQRVQDIDHVSDANPMNFILQMKQWWRGLLAS